MNIWKAFKVLSRFIQKRNPTSSLLGSRLYRILSSYWMAHFYLINIHIGLHCFGLDCGMRNSSLTSRNPKNNCCLSAFLEQRASLSVSASFFTVVYMFCLHVVHTFNKLHINIKLLHYYKTRNKLFALCLEQINCSCGNKVLTSRPNEGEGSIVVQPAGHHLIISISAQCLCVQYTTEKMKKILFYCLSILSTCLKTMNTSI